MKSNPYMGSGIASRPPRHPLSPLSRVPLLSVCLTPSVRRAHPQAGSHTLHVSRDTPRPEYPQM
ncbi:MAG: hypothetical protein R2795_24075 [Saprospiraceae bacterium]